MRQFKMYEKDERGFKAAILDYVPVRYKANNRVWNNRRLIWDFKNGINSYSVALMVGAALNQLLTEDEKKEVVFVCIPAHSKQDSVKRYGDFSDKVCKITHTANGCEHVIIEGERLCIHEYNHRKQVQETEVITFDKFFEGKKVVVFDDIITTGKSYDTFRRAIERAGATVIGGLFLANTIKY